MPAGRIARNQVIHLALELALSGRYHVQIRGSLQGHLHSGVAGHTIQTKRHTIGHQCSQPGPASRYKEYLAICLAGISFKMQWQVAQPVPKLQTRICLSAQGNEQGANSHPLKGEPPANDSHVYRTSTSATKFSAAWPKGVLGTRALHLLRRQACRARWH